MEVTSSQKTSGNWNFGSAYFFSEFAASMDILSGEMARYEHTLLHKFPERDAEIEVMLINFYENFCVLTAKYSSILSVVIKDLGLS